MSNANLQQSLALRMEAGSINCLCRNISMFTAYRNLLTIADSLPAHYIEYLFLLRSIILIHLIRRTTREQATKTYNWYFYLGGGGGKATSFGITAVTGGGQGGFEYRPNPYLGFGLGVGANNWAVDTGRDYQKEYLLLGASGIISSGGLSYLLLFSGGGIPPSTYTITYNTYAANFNFHINGEKTFDPYIGIGAIGGSCTGKVNCTVLGGEVRLGLQINFTRIFVYLQAQGQSINFKQEGNPLASNASNGMGIIGLGVRF